MTFPHCNLTIRRRCAPGSLALVLLCLMAIHISCDSSTTSSEDSLDSTGDEIRTNTDTGAEASSNGDESSTANTGATDSKESQMVVLIHGLGRTQFSMLALEWNLDRMGYQVLNWGYSSTCCTVDELGKELADELRAIEEPRPDQIHFVGHSLGNIITRWVLSNAPPPEPGRVVMLAPPNQGAEMADRYAEWLSWLLDPLDDLVTDDQSTVRTLPQLEERDVGIIAGQYDGKVKVDETHLEAEDSHEVVSSAHTFIMNRPDVHSKIASFLEHGHF